MKRLTRRTILATAPALAFTAPLLPPRPARAAKYGPGVTDSEIKIGNTGPYSGPASSYSSVPKSQAAYWQMINEGCKKRRCAPLRQHGDPEIRGAGDQKGGRDRVEAAPHP